MFNKKRIYSPFILIIYILGAIFIIFHNCKKLEEIRVLKIRTDTITDITSSSAEAKGTIIDLGGNEITEHGHCWAENANPAINGNNTDLGPVSSTGSFTSTISGLSPGTVYYIRSYATYGESITYGNQISFETNSELPVISTASVTSVTETTAQSGGNVTNDGGSTVTAKGVCWSTSQNPTLESNDGFTNDGTGTGSFTSNLSELLTGTAYYIRAYATNSKGTGYGEQESFETSGVIDYDENVYQTIAIGEQVWMKENLRTTHYSDGTPLVEGSCEGDISGDYTTKYQYVFLDNPDNAETLGLLYTWAAVMNGAPSSNKNPSGVQGVCPTGWHVPSDSEWKQLELFLGMSQAEVDTETGWRGTNEGTKLKEEGSSGFEAKLAGYRSHFGGCRSLGDRCYFHTSMESGTGQAWFRRLDLLETKIQRNYSEKNDGYSVRCIKD